MSRSSDERIIGFRGVCLDILSTTFTVLLSLGVLVSPLISNWMNNRHSMKMKELELKQDLYKTRYLHERETIENYLSAVSMFVNHSSNMSYDDYNRAYLKALFLLPDDLRSLLVTINAIIEQRDMTEAKKQLSDVVGQLRAYLSSFAVIEPTGKTHKTD